MASLARKYWFSNVCSIDVSSAGWGMCELTNQGRLVIREEGGGALKRQELKTERFRKEEEHSNNNNMSK